VKNLFVPAVLVTLATALTLAFILWPRPYTMALFTFVAQPLYLIAAAFYLRRVLAELRKKEVL
jgi:hypothetical protein